LILVRMPRAVTGVVSCADFALPCRLYAMSPTRLSRHSWNGHYRNRICKASCDNSVAGLHHSLIL
jgi:hypothetical protein